MDLRLEVNDRGGVPVVAAAGEIDFGSAPRLRELLIKRATEGATTVVVDLSGVEFLDSTGLGVLVGGMKRYRSLGGDLHLVVTTARVQAVLELTRLTTAFPIHASVDEAVEAAST